MSDAPRLLPMVSDGGGTTPPIFERVAIVGLGLIGASIAAAARRAWPSALVIGVDRQSVLERAIARHVVDVASESLMIVSEADLVILAAPTGQNLEVLSALPVTLSGEAVVTDVGGTKRAIVEAAGQLPPRLHFVGGHPLAGAAVGGIDHARPDLFTDRPWLFTKGGDDATLTRLAAFVTALGARPVVIASAADHDRLVAFLSHLPQLTATALMAVAGDGLQEDGLALAGRGLVDTTRLAASPSDIWRDVCQQNADEIGLALDELIGKLHELRDGLATPSVIDRAFGDANRWRAVLSRSRPT